MIECPICHVMNEDQAHFCSECGQRFNVQAQAPQPSFPTTPEPSFPNFPTVDNFGYGQQAAPQPQQPVFPPPGVQPPQMPPQMQYQPAAQAQQAETPFPTTVSFPEPNNSFQPPSAQAFQPSFPQEPASQGFSTSFPQEPAPMAPPEPLSPPPSLASEPPPPPRPKLHSPILGDANLGSDEEILPNRPFTAGKMRGLKGSPNPAQQDDEDEPPAPTKGKSGLRSPLLRGDDVDDSQNQSRFNKGGRPMRRNDDFDPPKKGGLRSPLLGGDDESDYPPAPRKGSRANKPADDDDDDYPPPNKPRGGLRSPLLNQDDDEAPQGRPGRPGKSGQNKSGSHLRSPLLGGVDDYEGDDDDNYPPASRSSSSSSSSFPHVKRHRDADPEPSDDYPQQAPKSKGGLRSPLLGASDDQYDDDDLPPNRSQSKFPHASGGKQKLHSPVLGGGSGQNFDYDDDEPYYEEISDPNVLRSPLLAAKTHADRPPATQAQPPQQPRGRQAQEQNQLQNQQWPGANNPAPAAPTPQATPPAAQFRDRGFAEPEPRNPDMWRDRGFSQPGGRTAPEPQTEQYNSPAAPAPSPPPEVAPATPPPAPVRKAPMRSALLGSSSAADDDYDAHPSSHRYAPPVQSGPPQPNMVLLVPSVIALLGKGFYVFSMLNILMTPTYRGMLADALAFMVLCIGLIIYAATGGKK